MAKDQRPKTEEKRPNFGLWALVLDSELVVSQSLDTISRRRYHAWLARLAVC